MTNRARASRLAPSPTGALHLGNIRTFLVNWALARRLGWRLLMRIEDLDGPRIKPESTAQTLEILAWLGIDHDGAVMIQSHDLEPYRQAMRRLAALGRIYACELSRREIETAASAPHASDMEPGGAASHRPSDRAAFRFERLDTNYRFVVGDHAVSIHDEFAGDSLHDPAREGGDFVVWTRRAVPAYQLAVVVDDARTGVTDVVRGDDLLPSAARQALLDEALGLGIPRWWHLPLVVGPDGRRLAKRHGDTRVLRYREMGVTPERLIGLMGYWCGIGAEREPMSAPEFRDALDLQRMSRNPIVFSAEDEQWLLARS